MMIYCQMEDCKHNDDHVCTKAEGVFLERRGRKFIECVHYELMIKKAREDNLQDCFEDCP